MVKKVEILTAWSANSGGVSRRCGAGRLNALLRFVLRDLASGKVRLSKPRIEPSITSQLQVEPVLQMAGVGHLGCQARARDGAWITKFARTRVWARKGGQSWSLAMYKDGRAPRVMICTISTLHPAYLHAAHVCRHGVLGCVQVGRMRRRIRADHDPGRLPVLRHSQ